MEKWDLVSFYLEERKKVVFPKEELESLRKTEREHIISNGKNIEFVSRENIYHTRNVRLLPFIYETMCKNNS